MLVKQIQHFLCVGVQSSIHMAGFWRCFTNTIHLVSNPHVDILRAKHSTWVTTTSPQGQRRSKWNPKYHPGWLTMLKKKWLTIFQDTLFKKTRHFYNNKNLFYSFRLVKDVYLETRKNPLSLQHRGPPSWSWDPKVVTCAISKGKMIFPKF